MANFTRRELTARTVEYAVPSGDAMGEFYKAYGAALNEWRRVNGKTEQDRTPDDWSTVEACGDEVVISFNIDLPPSSAEKALQRVRALCADALSAAGTNTLTGLEDPTPIPAWTTAVLDAIAGARRTDA